MAGCCTIEVSSFEVERTKEVVDALREGGVLSTTKSLACHHSSNFRIFHRSQNVVESLARPVDVVICEDSDRRGHLRDGSSHLASLVGLLDRHAS